MLYMYVRSPACLLFLIHFQYAEEKSVNFKKEPTQQSLTKHQVNPLNSTEGSSSLRSPVTESLLNDKKPYLLRFCSNKHNNTCSTRLPFQAWKRRIHYALFWLISKKMSAILFCSSFVRSFFYLPYCSYKTYRWVDECIVLLLLTCLRLYGFAVSMFGEGGWRGGYSNPGLKKKKIRSILYTM